MKEAVDDTAGAAQIVARQGLQVGQGPGGLRASKAQLGAGRSVAGKRWGQ